MTIKRRALTAVAALTATGTVLGLATPASAQIPAEDVQQVIDNLPAAAETLAAGLQAAVDTAVATQSAVATSAAVGQAVVDSGTVLVAGTEQFAALGLGLLLVNGGVQQTLLPYLTAIDDPSTAAGLVNPDAVSFLVDGLSDLVDVEVETLKRALVHALEGNLIDPPLGLGPAFYSEAVIGTLMNAFAWAGGNEGDAYTTPLESLVATLGITSIVVGGATEGQLSELEAQLAPLFDALAPVADELIPVIQGL